MRNMKLALEGLLLLPDDIGQSEVSADVDFTYTEGVSVMVLKDGQYHTRLDVEANPETGEVSLWKWDKATGSRERVLVILNARE